MRGRSFALAVALTLAASTAQADEPAAPAAPPAAAAPPPAAPARHEPTAGDLASARNALREGVSLRDKGDPNGALPRLQSAWDLVPTPITGFELGKTHLMLGHVLQAHELFAKVVRMPSSLEESSRSASAREESAKLMRDIQPRIPSLRVKLTLPPGATATIHIDDELITMSGAETTRLVETGPHDVVAKAGDGPEQKIRVDVAEAEVKDVVLSPQWLAPKPQPVIGANTPVVYVQSTNPLAFIGFSIAAAGILVASVSAVVFFNASDAAAARCGANYCPPFQPAGAKKDNTVDTEFDSARNRYGVSGALFIIGAVTAVVAGGVGAVFATRPVKERVTATTHPTIRPGGAGLVGSF